MLKFFNETYYLVLNYAYKLSPQEWVLVLAIMIVLGIFCLRGFGSRSNY
jgi:hypothetical protein